MKENLMAILPDWTEADFNHRVAQIVQQFQQDNVRAVGLWFDDAALFSCVLVACFQAKVNALLPPNLLAENQQWIADNADLLLDDEHFATYAIEQTVSAPKSLGDWQFDTEVWMKTSGSSGEAKIIQKNLDQLWREARAIFEILPFSNFENSLQIIGSVMAQHLYGLSFRVLLPLYARLQGKKWLIGREQLVFPDHLMNHSRQGLPTVWISSPALLTRLDCSITCFKDCSIVGILSSGGALAQDIGLTLQNVSSSSFLEIYGSTETGCIASRQPERHWKPLQDVKLGINDEGALWVESSRTIGREQTADAVKFFDDGFELLGRIDRIVKLGDKQVSLVAIEQDLQKHALVADAYVAQHPEKQRTVAWLALSTEGITFLRENGRKALTQTLKKYLSQFHEKFAQPRYWRLATSLPRNAQAKILRTDFEAVCRQEMREPEWRRVQSAVENALVLQATVPLDLIYFKGHFANFPLVPGVVELQWAVAQVPTLLGRTIEIERVDNLKYQQFLRPNDQVELTMSWDESKKRVKFLLKGNGEPCASGLLIEKVGAA